MKYIDPFQSITLVIYPYVVPCKGEKGYVGNWRKRQKYKYHGFYVVRLDDLNSNCF